MAFNILNIGFDGTVESSFGDRTNYQSNGDQNDIIYFLGTNYGTSAWSNPKNSHITVTTSNITSGDTAVLFDDSTPDATSGTIGNNGNGVATVVLNFTSCIINPTRVDIAGRTSGFGSNNRILNVQVEVSKDNTNWTPLKDPEDFPQFAGILWRNFYNDTDVSGYYKYLRFKYTNGVNNHPTVSISEIKIYGKLKRTDGGVASRVSPVTSLENLADSNITTPQEGDILYREAGFMQAEKETPYRTYREVLSNNFVISNTLFRRPNFYVLDPGGANRNVDLPSLATTGDYIRIRNLNPSFDLVIREPGPIAIQTLSTAAGSTQADCWYDGSNWNLVTY